ncbi:MAG: signal peptidase I [Opitutaceae bacterium]|nr:signal peptidase I [Opitutaceae bacterium]
MKTAPASALLKVAGLVLALIAGAVGATGAESGSASSVALATALEDAHLLASIKGDSVVRVEGTSMLPYFDNGAVLVVRPAKVDALAAGMVVVYRNHLGELVAHRVERGTADGWVVRGANNAKADSTLVTAENLVGTVYATFYSDPAAGREGLMLAGALAAKTRVALAASAR